MATLNQVTELMDVQLKIKTLKGRIQNETQELAVLSQKLVESEEGVYMGSLIQSLNASAKWVSKLGNDLITLEKRFIDLTEAQ